MLAQTLSNYRWNEAIKSKEMNSWISPQVKHLWNVAMYAVEIFSVIPCSLTLGHYEPSSLYTIDLHAYCKFCKAERGLF